MPGIATFMRVSIRQLQRDWSACLPGRPLPDGDIALPRRATAGSAGYDFFAPTDLQLAPGLTLTVPTGVRARMDPGWVLMVFPRSGLGFKYRMTLNNTVGIVDQDYFDADNEGHILIRFTNCGASPLSVRAGEAFAQGVFLPFGLTTDDDALAARRGGFGSTNPQGT